MISIIGIDHIVLRTNQLPDMLHFYVDVLGCAIERDRSEEMGLIQLRAGYALIDIINIDSKLGKLGGGAPSQSENNLDHFCLQIEAQSEQDILAYLTSHHIPVEEFTRRYGAQGFGPSLYIHDPEGNTVELKPHLSTIKKT